MTGNTPHAMKTVTSNADDISNSPVAIQAVLIMSVLIILTTSLLAYRARKASNISSMTTAPAKLGVTSDDKQRT